MGSGIRVFAVVVFSFAAVRLNAQQLSPRVFDISTVNGECSHAYSNGDSALILPANR
jgi:hypothetical protein